MAKPTDWTYDAKLHRYRNTKSGRIVTEKRAVTLRNDFISARADQLRGLTRELFAGGRSLASWELAARTHIAETWTAAYALGRGGVNAMTPADHAHLAGRIAEQHDYLAGFSRALAAGDVSEKQAVARSALYAGAAVRGHQEGRSAGHDGLELPAQPCDGSTQCLVNCRCYWTIAETTREWRVTWVATDDGKTCDDCLKRADEWSPLVLPKPTSNAVRPVRPHWAAARPRPRVPPRAPRVTSPAWRRTR